MAEKRQRLSRRQFVGKGLATLCSTIALPTYIPSHVLAAPGRPGANDRITTGHIGFRGMGRNHLKRMAPHVGALCDVDAKVLKTAYNSLDKKPRCYEDYRHLLEDKDIDAVVIATPDHWHGLMTIHACQAGKDVYVEKPACKYIAEGRAMVDAAEKYGSVVQVGSQGRNHPAANVLREYIQKGEIGRIERVECWHNDNPVGGDLAKFSPPPEYLNWDLWLGPAANRPYNPDYCHAQFRWMLDLGGGQIRDRGAHVFNLLSWFLGLDRTGPSHIEASGDHPSHGLWNCPTGFKAKYKFSKPDLTVVWDHTAKPAGDFEFGAVYYGTKGKVILCGGDGRVFPEEKVLKYGIEKGMKTVLPKGVRGHDYHFEDWLDCIRTRKTPRMDIETGHRVATMCILANMSYRLERELHWDPRKEQFIDDPGANGMLSMPGRKEFRF